ncbi:CoA-transferase family III [Geodermatophilus obscurus]|uniref:CoA-transferase family III n=1 Tax=Geodermatophilus obscurus TaxID=1861 RepID=A0A1M7URQ6_9ACTN|nr:CoA transferase [Geodermatophilus obscurus]SHN85701.1 CoA-transferase family III [Geodermatophilus obscurus]
MTDPSGSGPLAGTLVVDLSRALAGPQASMMLGDMGARVVEVETPGSGDDSRSWGPPFVGPEEDPVSTYCLSADRNKESLQLDLKSEAGRREVPRAASNHHPAIAPYGAFRARDGILQVAVGNDAQWRAVAAVLDLDAADRRFATGRDRVAHRPELIAAMEERLAARPAAEWLARLAEAGVPAGRVRTLDEAYTWEQTLGQGLVVDVDHPTLGTVQLPGPPLRLETLAGAPAGRQGHSAPPLLGQHDEEILGWLEEGSDR